MQAPMQGSPRSSQGLASACPHLHRLIKPAGWQGSLHGKPDAVYGPGPASPSSGKPQTPPSQPHRGPGSAGSRALLRGAPPGVGQRRRLAPPPPAGAPSSCAPPTSPINNTLHSANRTTKTNFRLTHRRRCCVARPHVPPPRPKTAPLPLARAPRPQPAWAPHRANRAATWPPQSTRLEMRYSRRLRHRYVLTQ